MYISSEQIWKEIQDIKRILNVLVERDIQHSIEEISLNRAAKQLRMGQKKIIQAVEEKQLKAIKYYDSQGKLRYRFRIQDIHDYQSLRLRYVMTTVSQNIEVEKSEDIARRIFGKNKK